MRKKKEQSTIINRKEKKTHLLEILISSVTPTVKCVDMLLGAERVIFFETVVEVNTAVDSECRKEETVE